MKIYETIILSIKKYKKLVFSKRFLPMCAKIIHSRKRFTPIEFVLLYITEAISSLFDHKIRIGYTNEIIKKEIIGWYLQPIINIFEEYKKPYKIVHFYKPDIQFFSLLGGGGGKQKIINSKCSYKIFYTRENASATSINKSFKKYDGNCADIVTLAMGFDFAVNKGSENYIRFPNWIRYFFRPLDTKDDIKKKLEEFKCYPKQKFCALINNHDKSNTRKPIYDMLSAISPIDCPGNFLHNDDTLRTVYFDHKIKYLQQYKFNICPENSIAEGYTTEKIFEAMYSGCIPVYTGWSRNPEPEIINPEIILWFEPNADNSQLTKDVKLLYENDKLYDSFLSKGFFVDTAVEKIYMYLQQYVQRISKIAYQFI